jgi:hypothetical protein
MRNVLSKFLGGAAVLCLAALSASASPINLTFNGSGTIGLSNSSSTNLTLCLGGGSPCTNSVSATGVGTGSFSGTTGFTIAASAPISLTEISNCVYANASLTGVTFVGGTLAGTLNSMTVSQTSSQVSSGLADISGMGTLTSVGGLSANAPFNFSGVLNVGVGVDICNLPGGQGTGGFTPTPEPGTLTLAASGLLFLGGAVRRWLVS